MSPRMLFAFLKAREDLERRIDARFGVVAAVIANVNRDSKSKPTPFGPADFFGSLVQEQTEEDHEEFLDGLAEVLNEGESLIELPA
jgi:hypothetical protein